MVVLRAALLPQKTRSFPGLIASPIMGAVFWKLEHFDGKVFVGPVEKLSTALPRALSTDGSLVESMPWRYSCVETLWIKRNALECRAPSRLQCLEDL